MLCGWDGVGGGALCGILGDDMNMYVATIQFLVFLEYATSTKAVNHEFDFLIFSDLLHDSLERHVSLHQLSTEEVLQIQCIERNPSPSLALELDHKDWVSAIHCYGNL